MQSTPDLRVESPAGTNEPHGLAVRPLVSVVIPTHNRAHLLGRAIRSVLAQTYTNLELIVVDDASTDTTPDVVAAITDPRLTYLRQPENRRAAAARNTGIRHARGELIAFQDDDDEWMPGKLERQVEALEAAGPGTGLCLSGYFRYEPNLTRYIGGERSFRDLDYTRGILADTNLIATPGWLARKPILLEAGLFDERMRAWDDWEFGLRLSRITRFTHVDQPLFVQDRVNGSGMWFHQKNFANDLRIVMSEYGDDFWVGQPKVRARHWAVIGRIACADGNTDEGRGWLRRAIHVDRSSGRAWISLLLSYLSPSAVSGASVLKQKALRLIRGNRAATART